VYISYNDLSVLILFEGLGLWCYVVVVSFIVGENQRKPPTCRKSLTNLIT